MKTEFDREIEALLRGGRGRARGDFARAPTPDSSHMDADELSAYAEGALPPAARARYVAHLADCDACRRIVTGVALSSGAAPVLEKQAGLAAGTAASSRETAGGPAAWLAALLSPRALRWAVPLLAIALTGVVAYVALRSHGEADMVAGISEREAQRQPAVTSNNAQVNSSTTTNGTAGPGASANANMNTNMSAAPPAADFTTAQQPADARKDEAVSGPVQGPRPGEAQTGATANTSEARPVRETATSAGTLADADEAPPAPAAAAPISPPAPKPTQLERAEVSEGEARRNEIKERDAQARNNASRRTANEEAPSGARAETAKRSPQPPPPTASVGAARGAAGAGRDAGDYSTRSRAAARRTVEGLTFERQDGAWVDVRYNDSMRTRDVGRGTEAYRTLVADAPVVGRIASRLSGTVIVVIDGRAYRIN